MTELEQLRAANDALTKRLERAIDVMNDAPTEDRAWNDKRRAFLASGSSTGEAPYCTKCGNVDGKVVTVAGAASVQGTTERHRSFMCGAACCEVRPIVEALDKRVTALETARDEQAVTYWQKDEK